MTPSIREILGLKEHGHKEGSGLYRSVFLVPKDKIDDSRRLFEARYVQEGVFMDEEIQKAQEVWKEIIDESQLPLHMALRSEAMYSTDAGYDCSDFLIWWAACMLLARDGRS